MTYEKLSKWLEMTPSDEKACEIIHAHVLIWIGGEFDH